VVVFKKSAELYDAISASRKDYAAEADAVRSVIAAAATRPVRSLLDVACGTGTHIEHLRAHYEEVVGLDLDPGLLAVAARRLPGVRLVEADMLTFDLGRQFDAVTCLGSSITYVRTPENLERAVERMARHVAPGGVLALEPFFSSEAFHWGHIGSLLVETPTLTVARLSTTGAPGPVGQVTFHYLVGDASGVRYFTEEHAFGMFTTGQLLDAFRHAGLAPTFHEQGPSGRGLVVGVAPSPSPSPTRRA
jgi:SAM-dependent methyltransferase